MGFQTYSCTYIQILLPGQAPVDAFISDGNKSLTPCVLPDAMMDGKVNAGYKGHDEFSRMQGYLLQKFPIYQPGDDKEKPTGGTRG